MNSWIILIMAGACEIVWALGLKCSDGFTKIIPSTVTVFFMILSGYLLALAARHISLSIAYSVWVGIGALGAFIGGVLLFQEKVNITQVLSLLLIVVGIIGLKMNYIE